VLGFASPAVSPTNLLYDVFATPGGVYRYVREGRVVWPLAWAVIGGTPPGAFVGALLRVTVLFAPRSFGAFVGLVLLYFGPRLLYGALSSGVAPPAKGPQAGRSRVGLVLTASGRVRRQALRLLRPRDLGALARRRGDRRHLGHRGRLDHRAVPGDADRHLPHACRRSSLLRTARGHGLWQLRWRARSAGLATRPHPGRRRAGRHVRGRKVAEARARGGDPRLARGFGRVPGLKYLL
jgi:hypothetical protein